MEFLQFLAQSIHGSTLFTAFLSTTMIVILPVFILLSIIKSRVLFCKCEICETYVESRWRGRFSNLCDWYTHLLKNSPTRTIHIHVLNNTVTANPANVEYILKTRFNNFPKGKPFAAILGDFLGKGIFNVDGDLWRSQRKLAILELGRVSTQDYAFQVAGEEISCRLIPVLESVCGGDEILDLQDVFRRFSFDFICRFSFGLDPNCLELPLPLPEFAVSFDLASRLSAERAMAAFPISWKIKRFFNVGSEKKLRESLKIVNIFAQEVIKQRRKLDFGKQNDLLSRFMSNTSDERYIRDIIISFLLAGRDTVASALTSFFLLVARHPEADAAILKEARTVLGPNHHKQNKLQMRELHYLHAAIHESMRLYPPIQFDSKFCSDDDCLPDGSRVKRGTRVTYHPYAMGRMEEIWGEDCLDFKPERWIRDGLFCHENPFKYPVFQAGVRVCVGKEISILEMKSVAVSLLRRFRVELDRPWHDPVFSPGLTATFSHGLRVRVRDRA